jgi:hypothetical protein
VVEVQRKIVLSMFILVLSYLLLGIFAHNNMVTVDISSFTATIYVDPQTSVGTIGQNFAVNINISDVVDLYGWEFKLGWNSTILDAIAVTEGPFLKRGDSTFFTYKINNTEGFVLVDCTLLGDIPGVGGNGTLATIEFHVKTVGECTLDLYDTILVSSAEQPIPHTAIDGYYYTAVRDVAVVDLVASATTVNVTVENQGNHYTETFDVSTYYTLLTEPLIGTQTVTLEPGANTTLTFVWTPPTYGRYEIRAEAGAVPGEVDTVDNTRTTIIYVGDGSSNGGGLHGCRSVLQ